ncbi:unnamed protein product, partial [Ectocarpus sp. 12 AP-2014]
MMIVPCAPEQAPSSPSTTSPSTAGDEEWPSPELPPPSSPATAVPVPAAVRDSNLDKGSAVVARRLRQAPLKASTIRSGRWWSWGLRMIRRRRCVLLPVRPLLLLLLHITPRRLLVRLVE